MELISAVVYVLPSNVTVPLLWLNVPEEVCDQLPVTYMFPGGALNVPEFSVKFPLMSRVVEEAVNVPVLEEKLPLTVILPEEPVNVPEENVKFPLTVSVPDGALNVPELIVQVPFMVTVASLAVKVPSEREKLPAPTVKVEAPPKVMLEVPLWL